MFNVDDYDYKNCNFTWDSIMFATSTLVMNEYGLAQVQMFHGPVYRTAFERLEKLIKPVDTKCYIRPFIKITDLFGVSK